MLKPVMSYGEFSAEMNNAGFDNTQTIRSLFASLLHAQTHASQCRDWVDLTAIPYDEFRQIVRRHDGFHFWQRFFGERPEPQLAELMGFRSRMNVYTADIHSYKNSCYEAKSRDGRFTDKFFGLPPPSGLKLKNGETNFHAVMDGRVSEYLSKVDGLGVPQEHSRFLSHAVLMDERHSRILYSGKVEVQTQTSSDIKSVEAINALPAVAAFLLGAARLFGAFVGARAGHFLPLETGTPLGLFRRPSYEEPRAIIERNIEKATAARTVIKRNFWEMPDQNKTAVPEKEPEFACKEDSRLQPIPTSKGFIRYPFEYMVEAGNLTGIPQERLSWARGRAKQLGELGLLDSLPQKLLSPPLGRGGQNVVYAGIPGTVVRFSKRTNFAERMIVLQEALKIFGINHTPIRTDPPALRMASEDGIMIQARMPATALSLDKIAGNLVIYSFPRGEMNPEYSVAAHVRKRFGTGAERDLLEIRERIISANAELRLISWERGYSVSTTWGNRYSCQNSTAIDVRGGDGWGDNLFYDPSLGWFLLDW